MLGSMQAGWAKGDITPPLGIAMGGYWGRTSGALGIADPLEAKVLVLVGGQVSLVLVALDLIGLDRATVGQIRRRLAASHDLAPSTIMVCCSHTHAGPLTLAFRGMGEIDNTYLVRLEDRVVELVDQAFGQLRELELGYGRVPVQLGENRRLLRRRPQRGGNGKDGPLVPYADILQFGAPGADGMTLFSHACHPVVLGNANHQISAEFPGAAARYIEAQTGGTAIFINGACGDINPRLTNADFAAVEELGRELGQGVVGALADIQPLRAESLRCHSEKLALPLSAPPPAFMLEVGKLTLKLKAEIAKIRSGGADKWAQLVHRARLDWAREILAVAAGQDQGRTQAFEIQAFGIGPLCLLGMEGEIFARYQLDLAGLPTRQPTMLTGFANGCIGYVPTADEYQWGGYEIDEAYKVYPSVQMIAPQSEALILQCARDLVEAVTNGR